MKTVYKIVAFAFVLAIIVSGCKKSGDPDPDLAIKAAIKEYVIHSTSGDESVLMTQWLDTMRIKKEDLKVTGTGLNYILQKSGTGATVATGDSLTVKYIGFFMNGGILDASDYHGGTMKYVHKTNRMIKGWEEGIEILNKGASAVFLIPSAKAYGSSGQGPVAPNVPLIFVIEVVDIK